MDIRIAKEQDMPNILHLVDECIKDMQSQGIDQWGEFYPTHDIMAKDIQNGSTYAIYDKSDCIGIITFDEEQEPECEEINWLSEWGRALIVHRLAVHPKWQHRRIGRKLMDFAEQFAVENKHTSIRLNAYSGNPRAISFYKKRGYKKTGQVYFAMRKLPFYCYEKVFSY